MEPLIGHMKSEGHLDRNCPLGTHGEAINAAFAAAGHNLRLLRRWLVHIIAILLAGMQAGSRA